MESSSFNLANQTAGQLGHYVRRIGGSKVPENPIDNPSSDKDFSLSAIYVEDGDVINVHFEEKVDGFDFNLVIDGYIKLYVRSYEDGDRLIDTIMFDNSQIENNSVDASFLHPIAYVDTYVIVELNQETDSSSKYFVVSVDLAQYEEEEKECQIETTIEDTSGVYIDSEIKPVIIELDYQALNPIKQGSGKYLYYGGGSRYLPYLEKSDSYFQENTVGEGETKGNPIHERTVTFIEPGASNILNNNLFLDYNDTEFIPTGWEVIGDDLSVIKGILSDELITGVNTWRLSMHTAIVFEASCTIKIKDKVVVDTTKPLVSSIIMSIDPLGHSKYSSIVITQRFFDGLDVEVGSNSKDYKQDMFINKSEVISIHNRENNYPTGTVTATFEIAFNGVNAGDSFVVNLTTPQMETSFVPTSRIALVNDRCRDCSKIINVNLDGFSSEKGKITVNFVSGFNDRLPFGGYLFDNRHPLSLTEGFALRHNNAGEFELIIHDGIQEFLIRTDSVFSLEQKTEYSVVAYWDVKQCLRIIDVNEAEAVNKLESFAVPQTMNDTFYLGSRSDEEKQITSEMISFKLSQ